MGTPLGYIGPTIISGCTNKMSQEPRKMKVILLGLTVPSLVDCMQSGPEMFLWQRNSLQCLSGMPRCWRERGGQALRWDRYFEITGITVGMAPPLQSSG